MSTISHLFACVCLLLSLTLVAFHATAAEKSIKPLHVGDPAPKLEPTGWLNGEPITEFKKGTVYVVECWATWCGPCKAAIPHLSELNTKYKDKNVEFIGLDVWDKDQSLVEQMVKKMAEEKTLNYRVALDANEKNATTWLRAAGQNGIPCTFLIDRDGIVAWIGHPDNLDDKLAKVVAGTFDYKAYLAQVEQERIEREQKRLNAGDPAPKLEPTGWLNGEPITEFKKGTVYVVECWATWCGPCKAAIPHLSALNTTYKDKNVEFIGLNVLEQNQSNVAPYVKKMVDEKKLNYRIALDARKNNAKKWLSAAGKHSLPCSFIVDRTGKIAWIGHPMELDEVLAGVVAGTYNQEAYAAKEAEIQKRRSEYSLRYYALIMKNAEDITGLRALFKDILRDDKEFAGGTLAIAVKELYSRKLYADANLLATDMSATEGLDARSVNNIAWVMISTKDVPAADRNIDLAVKLAEKACELSNNQEAYILDTMAHGYFLKGDKEKAISMAKQAITLAGTNEREKKAYQESLESFK